MKPRAQHPRSLADPDELAGAAANARDAAGNGDDEKNADVADLSYEAARDELVSVVRTLESGETTLDESMALWERGEALAQRCQAWLDGARERLDAARQDEEEPNESDQ